MPNGALLTGIEFIEVVEMHFGVFLETAKSVDLVLVRQGAVASSTAWRQMRVGFGLQLFFGQRLRDVVYLLPLARFDVEGVQVVVVDRVARENLLALVGPATKDVHLGTHGCGAMKVPPVRFDVALETKRH